MRARMTPFIPALVWLFVWTSSSIDAQQKPQARRPATQRATPPRPATEKPRAEAGAPAPGLVREVPLMQCPSVLGNGIRTQRLFCDILTGTEPQEGLRVSIPAHEGSATLLFTLHNRQATLDDAARDAAAKDATAKDATAKDASGKDAAAKDAAAAPSAKTFARYTAMLRVVTANGTLLRQTVVQSEFRGPTDLVERIAGGAGRGGVKTVAPTGSELIALALPAGVTEVSLLGEKLTIERLDGTEVVTAPGRPIAVVSQVQVEYRPPSSSGTRRRS
jgi:hypothetical protein